MKPLLLILIACCAFAAEESPVPGFDEAKKVIVKSEQAHLQLLGELNKQKQLYFKSLDLQRIKVEPLGNDPRQSDIKAYDELQWFNGFSERLNNHVQENSPIDDRVLNDKMFFTLYKKFKGPIPPFTWSKVAAVDPAPAPDVATAEPAPKPKKKLKAVLADGTVVESEGK